MATSLLFEGAVLRAATRPAPPAKQIEVPSKRIAGRRLIIVGQATDGTIVVRQETRSASGMELSLSRWYRAYSRRMEPIMTSWGRLGGQLRAHRLPDLAACCADLQQAVATLAQDQLPTAPHPAIQLHVSRSLSLVRRAAGVCRRDHVIELLYRYRVAQRSLQETEALLRLYGAER